MNFVALKGLTGDCVKYLRLIFTITSLSFVLENEASMLAGIMKTGSQVLELRAIVSSVLDSVHG